MTKSRKGNRSAQPFPGVLIRSINHILSDAFKNKLSGSVFKVDGSISQDELLLRIGVHDDKGELETEFDISIDHAKGENMEQKIHLLIDGIAHFLKAYFHKRGEVISGNWNEIKMGGAVFYVRQSAVNQ